MADLVTKSGKITERKEIPGKNEKTGAPYTRIRLTLGDPKDKVFVSYFKDDMYIRPEHLAILDNLKEGDEGEFICAVKEGAYGPNYNVKGFVPITRAEKMAEEVDQQVFEQRTTAPKSNRVDGDKKNRAFALSYAKDCFVAGLLGTKQDMFKLAEEMVMFLDGPLSDENGDA